MLKKSESGSSVIDEIFDESDQSGVKTRNKIFGETKIAAIDEVLKVAQSNGDIVQKIKDAKLGDIASMTNAYQENLAVVLGSVLKNTRLIDQTFKDLMKPDQVEQQLKDDAVRIVTEATNNLEEVKEWPSWRNWIFGAKDKAIVKRTQKLENAKLTAVSYEQKSEMLFDERIRKAGLDVLLPQYRHMCSVVIEKLMKMADLNMQDFDKLEIRHQKAIQIMQQSAKELEAIQKTVQSLSEELQKETENLKQNFVPGTEAHAAQTGVVDEIKQKYDNARSEQENMQAVYNSKENFAIITQATMSALKLTAGKMRSMAVGLRSDTSEREHTYPATLQLIKNAHTLEAGSNMDKIGREADSQGLQIAVSVAGAADKDFIERLEAHPQDVQKLMTISQTFDSMIAASKERWDLYRKTIAEGYDNIDGDKKEKQPVDELEGLLK